MPGPEYAVDQRVEVLTVDFEALHLPYVWTPGTVTVADPMDGGQRGGNKRIRAL